MGLYARCAHIGISNIPWQARFRSMYLTEDLKCTNSLFFVSCNSTQKMLLGTSRCASLAKLCWSDFLWETCHACFCNSICSGRKKELFTFQHDVVINTAQKSERSKVQIPICQGNLLAGQLGIITLSQPHLFHRVVVMRKKQRTGEGVSVNCFTSLLGEK